MLFSLFSALVDNYGFLNIFKYLTVRTGLAIFTSMFVVFIFWNPLINFYRLLTPKSRSKDEHPLVFNDFKIIKSNFKNVNIKYYGFLTLVFFPFYSSKDAKIFKFLVKLDQLLFKTKIFRYFAWSVLITAKKN